MHADLDVLLTALYVLVDDLLPRGCRRRGRRSRISDSELICLAVAQVLLDCLRAYPVRSAGTRFLASKRSLVIRRGRDRGSCGS